MFEKKFVNYFKQIIQSFLQKESGCVNLLFPIAFALGIIFYFSLSSEPSVFPFIIGCVLCLGGFLFLRTKSNCAFLFLIATFFFGGVCRISIQTDIVQAPFIHKSYSFVSVEGRVEKVEWRGKGIRLTLTDLTLDKIPQEDKPERIRISVNSRKIIPNVGDIISTKAKLSPPMLPWLPNGYNFARTAYFDKIGAVGFTMGKLAIVTAHKENHFLQNLRLDISKRILSILPNDTGNIATALVTGEQGGISKTTRDNYTGAGIVHVLSVSGFHMVLIAGFIFAALRFLFGLFPSSFLRFHSKKICALLALFLTLTYLLISGMAVPAVRSYLMIAFVLIAVILDRQAVSMRSVMWAGFLILLFSPEALTSASFALSFGAVIALVAGYEVFATPLKNFFYTKPRRIRLTLGVFCIFLIINFVAHIATAPIAVHHFHRYNNYGMLGNFLTSATFSFLIMPLLLVAMILMPVGLDRPFFLIVGYLLDKINLLTEWISSLPAATVFIPSFSTFGYGLILSGGLWVCILKSKFRLLGFICIAIGLTTASSHKMPDIIVGQGGKLIAVRQTDTYVFNTLRKEKSSRAVWLESNGINPNENVNQLDGNVITLNGLKIDLAGNSVGTFDIIINSSGKCNAIRLCLSRAKLWKEGTHTLFIEKDKIHVKTAADGTFNRPWGQGKYVNFYKRPHRPESHKSANNLQSSYPKTVPVDSSTSDKSNSLP